MIVQTAQINSLKTPGVSSSPNCLSDGDLLGRLMKARGTERAVQQRIVLYLAEVERRRLYLPLAYGSLFEFCTDYLKYSRSSATRRISAARCIARFPRMAELFRRGECELIVLSTIAGLVTKENCAEIAAWLKGRSLREVEAYVQRRQPERALRDRVRQIYVTSAQPAVGPRNGPALPTANTDHRTDTTPVTAAAPPTKSGNEKAPGAAATPGSAATPESFDAPLGVDAPGSTATPEAFDAPLGADAPRGVDAPRADLPVAVANKNHSISTPSAGPKTAQLVVNTSHKNQGVGAGSGDSMLCGGAEPAERIVVEKKYKLEFAVEPAFMEKHKRVLALLYAKYPGKIGFEMVFDIVMTDYLDRHSPEGRIKKRKQRSENKKKRNIERKKGVKNNKPAAGDNDAACGDNDTRCGDHGEAGDRCSGCEDHGKAGDRYSGSIDRGDTGKQSKKRRNSARTRHIPQAVRDEIFVRDGGRCTYVSPDGKRCGETNNLEMDHIIPYAKGGSNSPDNLRLLCFKHNQLEAEREYGFELMKKYKRKE